ncbi:alpha/beta hydrolase family protein [Chishuiella sp.]|uniref:alpha/beta hydrolase family protein n=1 Tax=Chishuiella sp. TaxID=1969467 RepID=UPI0028AF0589|nr:prolyl oligopeptidase family serine peptidase [Chishuiella sp.]
MKCIIIKLALILIQLFSLFNFQPLYAQPKPTITELEYDKWGTLAGNKLSEKGNWSSFYVTYPSVDSLFLVNNQTKKQLTIKGIREGFFMKEHTFLWLKNQELSLLNLKTNDITIIPFVNKIYLSQKYNKLITVEKEKADQQIVIRNQFGKVERQIKQIRNFSLDEKVNRMVYERTIDSTTYLEYLELAHPLSSYLIDQQKSVTYQNFSWNNKGIVMIKKDENSSRSTVCYFDEKQRKSDCMKIDLFEDEIDLTPRSLNLSKDSKLVYFNAKNKLVSKSTNDSVEIWYGSDQLIYPIRKAKDERGYELYTWVWNREENIVSQLTDTLLTSVHYLANAKKVLLYNKYEKTTDDKLINNHDLYLYDAITKSKKRIIKSFNRNASLIKNIAQTDNFIYYADNNWWMYDTGSEKNINLTSLIDTQWDNQEVDEAYQKEAWGVAGVSMDKEEIFIYDTYDIWKINWRTLAFNRITKGRESQRIFRFDFLDEKRKEVSYSNNLRELDIRQDARLIIDDLEARTKSYGILKPNLKINVFLESEDFLYSNLKQASLSKAFIFMKEAYNLPAEVWYQKATESAPVKIYSSNLQHYNYSWGKSELINYTTQNSQNLKAALFYPPHYKKDSIYPVIIRVYENLSHEVKKYHPPSWSNTIGFNVSNLTQQGYIVVLPDVNYKEGFAGESITNSVVAILNKLIKNGVTEKGKIGLIGQSFGGYETNYILTQTDLFSAAVTGAGFFDLIKGYFTMSDTFEKMESWRYENHQFRIRKTFYQSPDLYIKNSPLFYADKITTPLLSWTGLKDPIVSPEQTMTIYTALRKLNKNIIMLRYPNAGHFLLNRNDQKDLTKRVHEWFAYYLKNKRNSKWIK